MKGKIMNRMQSTSGDDDDILYDLEINYSTDDSFDIGFDSTEDLNDYFELKEWSKENDREKGEFELDD